MLQHGKPELDGIEGVRNEVDAGFGSTTELPGSRGGAELAGHDVPIGRPAEDTAVHELPAENTRATGA